MRTHTRAGARQCSHTKLGPCYGNSRIPEDPRPDWLPFRWCHAIDNRTGRWRALGQADWLAGWRAREPHRERSVYAARTVVFLCDGGATPQRYSVRPFPRWRSARDIYGRRSVPAAVVVRSERTRFLFFFFL